MKIINKQIKPYKKEIYYFPAWPEILDHKNQTNNNLLKSQAPIENKNVNIVFTGNVGEAQNFDNIFKVAKELKDKKNLNWIIIGTSRKLEEIKIKIRKDNITNFHF